MLAPIGFGFILGLEHAMDADHVVAVSTIVGRTRDIKRASLIGVIWGMGHTTTILLVGSLILILKSSLPTWLGPSLELLVGIMLVILGLDVMRKVKIEKLHIHRHSHGNKVHTHIHSHKDSYEHDHAHKPYIVGMVHGLAGSAALTLIVLTSIGSTFMGIIYLLVFGIGSITGMLIVSAMIRLPFKLTSRHNRINSVLKIGTGVISIMLGIMLIYQTNFIICNFINAYL